MIEDFDEKRFSKKLNTGCFTTLIIFGGLILIGLGYLIYTAIHYARITNIKWDSFDKERIARIEIFLDMTMPDDVKPVWFRRESGAGDSYSRLIVENISDPQAFLDKAYPDSEITEFTTDEEDFWEDKVSSNDNAKKKELQKVNHDSKNFSGIKDNLNSAIKGKGYSIEFTDIYIRNPNDDLSVDYYIGFGRTNSGYSAVITRMKS